MAQIVPALRLDAAIHIPWSSSNSQRRSRGCSRFLHGLLALQSVKLLVESRTPLSLCNAVVSGSAGLGFSSVRGVSSAPGLSLEDKECSSGDFCPLYSAKHEVPGPFAWWWSAFGLRTTGSRKGRGFRVAAVGTERAAKNGVASDSVEENGAVSYDVEEDGVASDDVGRKGLRVGSVSRVTKETSVEVSITLDGTGVCDCDTGIPFLDHMLDQLASHGLFDVKVKAKGDTHIDDHHTNEDVGLALGSALLQALGDRKGITRFGDFSAPLDEALVHVVLDLSGRPYLGYDLKFRTERIGNYDTQLVEHFFQSMANTSGMTLHIRQLAGVNSHHIVEASFKAFARALRQAAEYDARRLGSIPSSKGVLSRA